ncbi:MAG: glycosyltransferase [Acidobacteriota bacterium]
MNLEGVRISVVVLGDLGRSPRMRYQALSLAAEGAAVDLIGYRQSALPQRLQENPRVTVHSLPAPRAIDPGRGRRIWWDGLLRLAGQSLRLLRRLLFGAPRPRILLVQNPPSVPTLAVAWLAARLRGARLVVDWHNFGATLLALKLGEGHRAVRAMARYERFFGRRADAHLSVSRAMAEELEEKCGLCDVRVLYDRPPAVFQPAARHRRTHLLRRLALMEQAPESSGIVVSATSWTLDEDFSLLIDAVRRIDRTLSKRRQLASADDPPSLVFVLTGRGPLRSAYEADFANLDLQHSRILTRWLTPEDYPLLLAAADLGLCLHRSSSGLDLPMKVADMLGSGLPVCAFDYGPVLAEQLRTGENGVLFTTGEELADRILHLFEGFPGPNSAIARLREALHNRPVERWDDGWRRDARRTFEGLLR